MLSGSRGDSTSVTKYPYVSPLPEAPSRLECYWYVDVSSRTETIGAPFESIMSAANASHPFSIPFSVFLPRLPMFMYVRLITESEDMRLFVSYARRRQWRSRGSRLNTLVSRGLPPLFSSSPSPYLFSCSQLHTSIPDATSKLYTRGRKGSPTPDSDSRNFASSRPFDRSVARPSFFFFSSETLESLLRLFTYYRTHFHPSIVVCSLGISFRHIGRKRTFLIFRSE